MKKTILVNGMTCGHCVKRVENALLGIEGVLAVVVNLAEKNAIVESEVDIDESLLREAIDDVGYEIESIH